MAFAFLLFTFSFTSQDDSKAGFYADGVKVNEINCYSFGELKVLIPFKDTYTGFDRFIFEFTFNEPQNGGRFGGMGACTKAKAVKIKKGGYIILTVFKKGEMTSE